ncbi:MAG: segregation and condensation protein A [Candidatus Binatia bacterium]|nr:MAG: segregation and condensation protein A [Candidatus Binatia bacterium]
MNDEERETWGDSPETYPRPEFRLDVFDGPLDLLLHLIKKNEVEITDIPVARITEQYLEVLEFMEELRLDVAAEFLVMAATLLLIKSRMLLPEEPSGAAAEDGEEDPRTELVRRLLEYQRYREAASILAGRPQLYQEVFPRPDAEEAEEPEPGPTKVSVWELLDAFRRVLERTRAAPVHRVERERVSLRDRVRLVLGALAARRRLTFDSLFEGSWTRLELVVTFLAVLELVRLGAVAAEQPEPLGPIVLVLAVDDPSRVRVDLLPEYEGEHEREPRA